MSATKTCDLVATLLKYYTMVQLVKTLTVQASLLREIDFILKINVSKFSIQRSLFRKHVLSSSFYQKPSSFNFLAGFSDLSIPSVITQDDYPELNSINKQFSQGVFTNTKIIE